MVKNVTVTVVGEQRTSREENNVEPIELVTRGSLHEKDGERRREDKLEVKSAEV